MKLAIMQPYFLPYVGYFQLINSVDKWVVFDSIQYIRRGWVNRNRILSPNIEKQWQYISVPIIAQKRNAFINHTIINNEINWHAEIFGKLTYYKQIGAPYYSDVTQLVQKSFDHKFKYLSHLNIELLRSICQYLDIPFDYSICSEQDYDFSEVNGAGDWALEIARQSNADEYINPVGGHSLFNRERFNDAGIRLSFLSTSDFEYHQSKREFVSSLSILDIMMFNSKSQIQSILTNNTKISS